MAAKKWIWIAVGLLAAALLACGGLVGTLAYFSLRHLNIRKVSVEFGEREFDQVRERFAGKAPLIEIDEDAWERPRIHRPPAEVEPRPTQPVQTIHVMVWDDRQGNLVRLDLPMWILKLNRRGRSYIFSSDNFGDLERLNLSAEDIERNGPGLILDHRGRRGERILVWTE